MQGGIADHTARLIDHLAPLEVEASVLISRRWSSSLSPNSSLNSTQAEAAYLPAVYPQLPNWGWRCWPAIRRFLEERRPDILHIQYQAAAFELGGWVNWLPWYLKKRGLKTRLVTTFHDLRIPYLFPKAGAFRWKSMLALARYSDAVICTDRENLQILQRQLSVSKEEQRRSGPLLKLIPLGSNVEPQPPANYDRMAWRAKDGFTPETFLMAYFGFLNESKGGEALIKALALLRQQGLDAQLLLIGGEVGHADPTNMAYAEQVQSLIHQYGLTHFVHRTGYVALPEVSAHLLAADAVVMPYREGVSFRRTSLIAALRHGCPVVSTRPPEPQLIPEIQHGQNMLLAPPDHAAALAETIGLLIGNPQLQARLAEGAKTLGARFEWANIAAETRQLYEAIAV